MFRVFIDVLVPVFAIVAIGFVIARAVRVEPSALAKLSYWILGPAFIFDVLATADLDPSLIVNVVSATTITMIAAGAVAVIVTRLLRLGFPSVAANVVTSIYGNVGNFGLAISAFALGQEVLPIAGIVMVTVNTLGILVGVGLANFRHGSIVRAVKTAALSPLALAVVPALLVNISNLELPVWANRPVSLLAAALIPVMLLTLGIQLAHMRRTVPNPLIAAPITIKLVFAPLAALGAAALLDLGGVAGDVVVLQASMPAAVFTSLIALEHDLEADYVTSVVLAGTLASVLTLPAIIAWL